MRCTLDKRIVRLQREIESLESAQATLRMKVNNLKKVYRLKARREREAKHREEGTL